MQLFLFVTPDNFLAAQRPHSPAVGRANASPNVRWNALLCVLSERDLVIGGLSGWCGGMGPLSTRLKSPDEPNSAADVVEDE